MIARSNPFDVTKASDFSDEQIQSTWVDLLGSRRFIDLAAPTSPMPMFILGGKGSGKTHLMRYLSFSLQCLRNQEDPVKGLREEGYLGVYLRCSGLNAGRFSKKGLSSDRWIELFSQYMDLWLAHLTIDAVKQAFGDDRTFAQAEPEICSRVLEVLTVGDRKPTKSIVELLHLMRGYQREMDVAINNAALSRELNIPIRSTPGHLVYRVPAILVGLLPPLEGLQILYLLDELENLTEEQQRYVNTLVREREAPSSFKIGGRTWGVRTQRTLNADEENKKGSEYDVLKLDVTMRESAERYGVFSRRVLIKRLIESGHFPRATHDDELVRVIDRTFELRERGKFAELETAFVRGGQLERPYWQRLENQLSQGLAKGAAWGLNAKADVPQILSLLAVPESPLLEKVNILLFYRAWSERKSLMRAAKSIAEDARAYTAAPNEEARYKTVLQHFRGDLMAQLRRDYSQKQRYAGLNTFISMSSGLPRNLLIIVKHVYQWAAYNGEEPFVRGTISLDAQRAGVLDASNWFYEDNRVKGAIGDAADTAIRRLSTLFKAIRYSDKPAECSVIAFSGNVPEASDVAQRTIRWAEERSLLLSIRAGQRDRNVERLDEKYQLNSMLAPRWDLPVFRRGALALSVSELNAIFDPNSVDEFEDVLRERVARMTAPYFNRQMVKFEDHPVFPGLGDA